MPRRFTSFARTGLCQTDVHARPLVRPLAGSSQEALGPGPLENWRWEPALVVPVRNGGIFRNRGGPHFDGFSPPSRLHWAAVARKALFVSRTMIPAASYRSWGSGEHARLWEVSIRQGGHNIGPSLVPNRGKRWFRCRRPRQSCQVPSYLPKARGGSSPRASATTASTLPRHVQESSWRCTLTPGKAAFTISLLEHSSVPWRRHKEVFPRWIASKPSRGASCCEGL